jgi:hypothetical protein
MDRESYIALAWATGRRTDWDPELEVELPEEFQDRSRFG